MSQSIIQVDAFTQAPFSGNPAAVCVLAKAGDDAWMQAIAAEMNLSETAFLYPEADGYRLRWFTPTVEVDLCGHATLATAHVLWTEGHLEPDQAATFYSRSGPLRATRHKDWIQLDFPANLSQAIAPPEGVSRALGAEIKHISQNSLGYIAELASAETVQQLQPDFVALASFPVHGVIVTSQSTAPYDFVSRFFAPSLGINEDPVTGAAHCCLGPYWQKILGKSDFLAYQASARGGVVKVRCQGDRILLAGQAVTTLRGELTC